ncbi:transposase [Streptomyces sp. NBC_01515]|uniref:transposase n=1 Tax=Streptomyces sp. NBC_01515 TaxID=2903890 RepID=UPI00386BBB27
MRAAKILGHVGDVGRFLTEHHFASYAGSVPLDASSGKNLRHRLKSGRKPDPEFGPAHHRHLPAPRLRPGVLPTQDCRRKDVG